MLADTFELKVNITYQIISKCLYDEKRKESLNAMRKRKTFIFEKKGKKAHVLSY
jgi:hypothetical protein